MLRVLNAKFVSLTCSLKKDYVGDSKNILGETLKDSDYNIPAIDDNINVNVKLKKITELTINMRTMINMRSSNFCF